MKKTLYNIYLFSFFLLVDFVAFAQPGSDNPTGDLEGTDPPPAPINGKLIWLLIIAIAFAFYTYSNKRKEV